MNRQSLIRYSQNIQPISYQLGIIGGMGALSAAAFLNQYYKHQAKNSITEQQMSNVILLNVADMPDRSDHFTSNQLDSLLIPLEQAIQQLYAMGIKNIVVLCYTIHLAFSRLPTPIQASLKSLVTFTLQEIIKQRKKCILLCTAVTHQEQLFQQNSLWLAASPYVIPLLPQHQKTIQAYIYDLKLNRKLTEVMDFIIYLLQFYQVDSWVTGCTEFFIIVDEMRSHLLSQYHAIDPIGALSNKSSMTHDRTTLCVE